MKYFKLLLSLVISVALIYLLNNNIGSIPPLGKLLSPQHGLWRNGDIASDYTNATLNLPNLKGKAHIYFDKRLVPHIFASNEEDAFYLQGYIHAKYRLWQMEFQTHAAAGRLTELVGAKALPLDRKMRRLGMVYAAHIAVAESQKDPLTKLATDRYTEGVNAYINTLQPKDYPIEYKLLNYSPEQWNPLKTALLLKYMSYDLAGFEDDFEKENAKQLLTKLQYEIAYEYGNDSLSPITPKGTLIAAPSVALTIPASADSAYFNYKKETISNGILDATKPNKNNGSNNWAVSGSKTKSGKPILCNDPHLGLNLPSLWYELQIHTPTYNTYGASFPGAPGVIIGFNDSCSFGFTNAMRDVRDYYEITFKDASKKEYWFNIAWQPSRLQYDTFTIKSGTIYIDTVAYTKTFGPVMYDASFRGTGISNSKVSRTNGKNYAVKWMAHYPSNELRTFLLLNRSKSFADYEAAIKTFVCPGQNMIFASHNGDIAIKQQGLFPAKWYRQGDFPMPGTDSTYLWQGMITDAENVMNKNPERGYVSSCNQYPYDTKVYPYYLGGNYPFTRGYTVNKYLNNMSSITPQDMQKMQNDNYNVQAQMLLPILLRNIQESKLNAAAKSYLTMLKTWNYRADVQEVGPTLYTQWQAAIHKAIWDDELAASNNTVTPEKSTLLDALRRDSTMPYIDNITTTAKETLPQIVTETFVALIPTWDALLKDNKLAWSTYKSTYAKHLIDVDKKMPFSRFNLNIGGGSNIINATTENHGPSWRMIVHMTNKVEAYGVYPGGQSGNPGSTYYDNFLDTWASGKYYTLWLMQPNEVDSKDILFTLTF